ncbi:MAG TPA: NAD-dependent epimerase/dehydratase family protein [Candidatus Saccharimonadales bacterium]|nr:NAD-dependent epimerase/dehydratase family protein [Candidatus Saccharimonadales bacterium]
MANQTENILVTGGAGFIGSHLVERLIGEGKRVTVIDDLSTGRLENLRSMRGHAGLEIIQTKVSECRNLADLAGRSQMIYHLAAAVGVELVMNSSLRTIESNVRETQSILDAASAHGTPILLASTSEVYGKSNKAAFCEEDDLLIGPPHLSRWSYACSKLMDEFLALAHAREKKTPVVIVRLFNTVGPRQTGQYGMVLPRFIEAARKGEPLKVFGDGSQTRCFCYVADTVEALLRLRSCQEARGEIFNVGSTEEISMSNLGELVIDVMGSSSAIEYVPYAQAYAPGFQDMLRRKPIVDKLARHTGFRPITSLRQIVEWTAAGGK